MIGDRPRVKMKQNVYGCFAPQDVSRIVETDEQPRDMEAFLLLKSKREKCWTVREQWALLFAFQQGINQIVHHFALGETSQGENVKATRSQYFSASEWKSQYLGRTSISRKRLLEIVKDNQPDSQVSDKLDDDAEENVSRKWCRSVCRSISTKFMKPNRWDRELFDNSFQDQLTCGCDDDFGRKDEGICSRAKSILLAVVFEFCLPCMLGCCLQCLWIR